MANDDMRALVKTFKSHLRDEGSPNDNETVWLLLRRLQILTFDFTAPGSASHDLALERAVRVLHTDDVWRAGVFWVSIRAKVEHPFRVVKRQFGYVKVRYRGLKKNTAQPVTLFALSNLWLARHKLLACMEQVRVHRA